MRIEIRRETPVPTPPQVKDVVLTLTRQEALALRKLVGEVNPKHDYTLRNKLTEHQSYSPAVDPEFTGGLCSAIWRALEPII